MPAIKSIMHYAAVYTCELNYCCGFNIREHIYVSALCVQYQNVHAYISLKRECVYVCVCVRVVCVFVCMSAYASCRIQSA